MYANKPNKHSNKYLNKNLNKYLVILLLISNNIYALNSDINQAINIKADSAELNNNKGTSAYIGNVIITQGTIKITADKVIINRNNKGEVDLFKAFGKPAYYEQQLDNNNNKTNNTANNIIKAHANIIEYHNLLNNINLINKAQINYQDNIFSSDNITYDINKQIIKGGNNQTNNNKANNNSRIDITIAPQSKP